MVSGGIMGNVCGVNDRAMYVIVNEQGFASYFCYLCVLQCLSTPNVFSARLIQ